MAKADALLDQATDRLRASVGERSVIWRAGRQITVIEGVHGAHPLDSVAEHERLRATGSRSAGSAYATYKKQCEVIEKYRLLVPEFESQLFAQPRALVVTAPKAVPVRPQRMAPEEFERRKRHIAPPFEWLNQRVNDQQSGCLGGIQEVLIGVVDRLLSTGLCGWWMGFETVNERGVYLRAPRQLLTYSGLQCQLDTSAQDGVERWAVKVPGGERPLRDDPEAGSYAGVIKYDHPVGAVMPYPTPPYFSLLDALLAIEVQQRGDLAGLTQNERTVAFWKFDFEKMREADLEWDDTFDNEGNVVKGAMSIWQEAREAARGGLLNGTREYMLPSYIEYQEVHPELDLIKAVNRYLPHTVRIALFGGARFAPDGSYLKEESEEAREVMFQHLREHILERFLQRLYDAVVAENVTWMGKLNGLPEWNPFLYVDETLGRQLRRRRPPQSGERASAQKLERAEAILEGLVEPIRVRARLSPAIARRNSRLSEVLAMARQGVISPTSAQEQAGFDPDLEAERMQEFWSVLVDLTPGKTPLFSPGPSYTQAAVTDNKAQQTSGRLTPGRTPGTTDEAPEETIEHRNEPA